MIHHIFDHAGEFLGLRITDRIRQIDCRGSGIDGWLDNFADKVRFGAGKSSQENSHIFLYSWRSVSRILLQCAGLPPAFCAICAPCGGEMWR